MYINSYYFFIVYRLVILLTETLSYLDTWILRVHVQMNCIKALVIGSILFKSMDFQRHFDTAVPMLHLRQVSIIILIKPITGVEGGGVVSNYPNFFKGWRLLCLVPSSLAKCFRSTLLPRKRSFVRRGADQKLYPSDPKMVHVINT